MNVFIRVKMKNTQVKEYSDKQLLTKVKSLTNYKSIPTGYWILGIRSNEDTSNVYDDKFYLFKGTEFILVTTGTTNAGKPALINGWKKVNKKGAFVLKSDFWHYNIWKHGMHNNKMKALIQTGAVATGYRDNNNNSKSEEIGDIVFGWFGINFHANSYNLFKGLYNWIIGEWSYGCQVCNNLTDYYKIIDLTENQENISYCLINEF